MNWLAVHYEWVIVVIVMPIVLLVLKRLLEPKKTPSEAMKTQASMATGPGSTQIVGDIHAREVHFSPSIEAIASSPGKSASVSSIPSGTPIPNLQYVTSKEKRVFVSPLSREGICDPHNEEEHKNSVQALVLKFENRVLPGRKIASAWDVIAKIRFKSQDGVTERVIDYGVWLNSPCNCVDMGIGDTRELLLMCDIDETLMCFEDRREGNH